ncbi:hypothetical protein LX36DRAFT_331752 [Colletotrichum falcatum]|nr:hypothetical protein LX36DRAFT_331752 [Colletotrichum falcatum]
MQQSGQNMRGMHLLHIPTNEIIHSFELTRCQSAKQHRALSSLCSKFQQPMRLFTSPLLDSQTIYARRRHPIRRGGRVKAPCEGRVLFAGSGPLGPSVPADILTGNLFFTESLKRLPCCTDSNDTSSIMRVHLRPRPRLSFRTPACRRPVKRMDM